MIKTAIISSFVTASVGAVGYLGVEAVLIAGDNRYLTQESYIQDNKNRDIRAYQLQVDELEFDRTQRKLTAKEQWELQRIKSEINLIRGEK